MSEREREGQWPIEVGQWAMEMENEMIVCNRTESGGIATVTFCFGAKIIEILGLGKKFGDKIINK